MSSVLWLLVGVVLGGLGTLLAQAMVIQALEKIREEQRDADKQAKDDLEVEFD